MYLSVSEHAISSALVSEKEKKQVPIYYVSKVLQGAETRYQKIEQLALALITSARRLRQYFQSHHIIVRTDQPIRQILQKPELAGRLVAWSVDVPYLELGYRMWTRVADESDLYAVVGVWIWMLGMVWRTRILSELDGGGEYLQGTPMLKSVRAIIWVKGFLE